VALLARQVAVLPSQLKAGRQMVELGALLGAECRRRKRKCEQKCQKQGECTHVIALTQASALEAEGAMTFLTLTSVLAQMYVIL
jgi:hypothetical protein